MKTFDNNNSEKIPRIIGELAFELNRKDYGSITNRKIPISSNIIDSSNFKFYSRNCYEWCI